MKRLIKVYLLTGDVLELEVQADTDEAACRAAKAKAKKALQTGVRHNHDGLRLYPAHMIKCIEIR
jgi:hypothetical protein